MPQTAARKKRTRVGAPSPYGFTTIHSDKHYDATSIINEGLVQFAVEFPPDKNVCAIKLHIEFKNEPRYIDEGGGGTIKIET